MTAVTAVIFLFLSSTAERICSLGLVFYIVNNRDTYPISLRTLCRT